MLAGDIQDVGFRHWAGDGMTTIKDHDWRALTLCAAVAVRKVPALRVMAACAPGVPLWLSTVSRGL